MAALSTSGLTRLIDRMFRQGLVERVPCESDGRGQMARLTDEGLARLEHVYPYALASVRTNVMDHLTDVDLDTFARAVAKFVPKDTSHPARRAHG
jgi:DNA-binding MarR family transcriptional regulator